MRANNKDGGQHRCGGLRGTYRQGGTTLCRAVLFPPQRAIDVVTDVPHEEEIIMLLVYIDLAGSMLAPPEY